MTIYYILKKKNSSPYPLKPVKRKVNKPLQNQRNNKKQYTRAFYVLIIVTVLAGIYNYATVLKGAASFYRWVGDTFISTDYPHYSSYNIRIPKGYALHGIDVSRHQGKINWESVAAMEERDVRIDFAFIKASEGILSVDPYFQRNWKEAMRVGLMRGAYHYFKPKKSGRWQANLFLKVVNFERGDLLPVVDIEETGGKSKAELRNNLKIFVNQIESKLGVKPIIYTGYKFYIDNLEGHFDNYPLWVAHYYRAKPKTDVKWRFWQHSDKGHINGIVYQVDMNVFNGDVDDLENWLIP